MSVTEPPRRRIRRNRSQPPLWLRLVISIFLVIFLLGGLYSSYLFYATIREIVAHTDLPALPVIQLPVLGLPDVAAEQPPEEEVPVLPQPQQTPDVLPGSVAAAPPEAPPLIPGSSDRINILLLGIDRRTGQGWGTRTDTIIIVTVDPTNNTAGMLSIPRDLHLAIPGYGEDRINVANVDGERDNYPGGGPALLKRTIEANFGIPIDYYIMIDFQGFVKIIDTLGGVDINVERKLRDTMYPDPLPGDPGHFTTIQFDAGPQHMTGARALQFARSRMSTSDFDRARRQQQVLVGIRDKALSLNIIPKLPSLAVTMAGSFKTDMTPDEMLQLARLGPQIDMANVKSVVLQPPLVYGHRRSDGAAVQLPKWDKINPVVASLFTTPLVVVPTPTPAPPTPTPTMSPVQVQALQDLAREGARIAVQNGTAEPNFAARVAALLIQQGYQVVEFGDADRLDYPHTVIVDYTGKNYTLEQLVAVFQVMPENVRRSPNVLSPVDVRVIVGQDYVLPAP